MMGQAKVRKLRGTYPKQTVAKSPAPIVGDDGLMTVTLKLGRKIEKVTEDGKILRSMILHAYLADGSQLIEDTPQGKRPVEWGSSPLWVGNTVAIVGR